MEKIQAIYGNIFRPYISLDIPEKENLYKQYIYIYIYI